MARPPDPFAPGSDADDDVLVAAARSGDRRAITELVTRHRPWIYNISLRMLWEASKAEDATQDILIKMLQSVERFEGRSKFRTWLYRIAVNHVLNLRKGTFEQLVGGSFAEFGRGLAEAPAQPLPKYEGVEHDFLVEEAKVSCMTGMLLCLDREQRIAYILGAVFELEDTDAAEILDITREAFRKRLSRAREDLHSFMNEKCGLVKTENPCRCERKTKAFIDRGMVDPRRLTFHRDHSSRVRDVASKRAHTVFAAVTEDYPRLFREHPFADPAGVDGAVRRALVGTPFEGVFDEP